MFVQYYLANNDKVRGCSYNVLPKIVFVAVFYGLLVTHLVAHRFTLGNHIIAIPIIYLLRVI